MTTESVRQAAAAPDLNHRDPEYIAMVREVRERLLGVEQGSLQWTPYLIGGSGTAAVEAMIISCIGKERCLILANGYYSERLEEIFQIYGLDHLTVKWGWLEPWNFKQIESELSTGRYTWVLATHHETTSGRLNDVGKLGRLCRQHDCKCLVDSMSSFGADPVPLENIEAIASSANKCLHGIPGVSFVLANPETSEGIDAAAPRSYYLALSRYAGESPPMTPPVPAMSAFRQALREWTPERPEDYSKRSGFVRKQLAMRGFEPAIPLDASSVTLTTYKLPEGWTADEWIDANRKEGFALYACKGALKESYFQVSVMGALSMSDLTDWIRVVDKLLARRIKAS